MKRRLRRFLLIGLLITAVDLGLLALVGSWWGERWLPADVVAVTCATILSYLLHRLVTFNDDAYSQIEHRPLVFLAAVSPAVATDLVTVGVFDLATDLSVTAVLFVKLLAVSLASVVRLFSYRGVLFAAVRTEQRRELSATQLDRVSVVLPAYNAAGEVGRSIERVREALSPLDVDVEVVVADDGSSDDTVATAQAAGADLVLSLGVNRGKGAAVRAGMLAASGDVRIFTDVDLAYPPHQLVPMVEQLANGWDVVVGSRRHPDTRHIRSAPAVRELGSVFFNVLTHFVLLGRYRDTQCGLKGFSAASAIEIFEVSRIDGFAFDVEVLHLAERQHMSLLEVPVLLDHVEATTVRLLPQATRMLRDVLSVRRWSATGGYDQPLTDSNP